MISQEALQLLIDTSKDSGGVSIVDIPGDPKTKLIANGGAFEKHELPPADRTHKAETVDALLSVVEEFGEEATIWHNDAAIVGILEGEHRRDTVTMKLVHSPQYETLFALQRPTPKTQRDFVKLLRHDLAGCVEPHLVTTFRAVEFKRRNDGSGTVQHGKESLGKSVEASVTAAQDIPEFIVVELPVYANAGLLYAHPVPCTIDLDAAGETFTLQPQPNAINRAVQEIQTKIGERLDNGADVAVFYGAPS